MILVSARYSSVFLYSLTPLSSINTYYKCWCCVQGLALEGVNRWEAGLDIKEREWVSKERGNTSLTALLVRVE